MREVLVVAAGLLALLPGGLPARAEPGATPSAERAAATEAARLYLGQSLGALDWALRYARQAGQLGPLEGFDLQRYVEELGLVARGVQRYLDPQGPPPGPAAPVEITGQFLVEGLARTLPSRAGAAQRPPPASPERAAGGAPPE